MLIKKYANRRLYDTQNSRYITLDELAEAIRKGANPRIIDAKSEQDLTQATLAQLILESRGASRLLPTPLLMQLIRLGDDALGEFFGQYVSWALGVYIQARQQTQGISSGLPPNPFANPFFAAAPWFNPPPMAGGAPPTPQPPQPTPPPPQPPATPQPEAAADDDADADAGEDADDTAARFEALMREVVALKATLKNQGAKKG